jgi:hypothetical protein
LKFINQKNADGGDEKSPEVFKACV